MVWFWVPRETLVLFDFGPRETYFPPKLAYASRGGTTALEAYQRLSRAEIPRETLKTMTWLYKGSHPQQKVMFLWTFSVRGGGAQPHSIAFRGVFTNFTEAIFG